MFPCKSFLLALVIGFTSCLSGLAEIPNTPNFQQYAHLLKRSPFTIKMNQMIKNVNAPRVRQDYFLRGVTKLEKGWVAVIVNRLTPKENIIVEQGVANSMGVELLDVIQNKRDYKLTLAKLKVGTQEMTIGYNKAELKKALQLQPAPVTQGKDTNKSKQGSPSQTQAKATQEQNSQQPKKNGKPVPKTITPSF